MISLELCEISLVFREIKTVVFTTTSQMHCEASENKSRATSVLRKESRVSRLQFLTRRLP